MKVIRRAFLLTIPVMLGYLVMGMAFGMLLEKTGFSVLWALGISLSVYAGSMQFVLIGFLGSGIGFLSAALMTLTINSRHLFYGISFLEKFKSMGKRYPYMIFSLTDETYSLLCGLQKYKGIKQEDLMFAIAALDQLYWVTGCVVGNLVGSILTFNTKGLDFSMTALFVVIFIEQWYAYKNHFPAIIGLCCSILGLVLLGPSAFLLPSLILTVTLLMLLSRFIETKGTGGEPTC